MKLKDLKKPDPGFLRVAFIGKEVIADDGCPYLLMALAEREAEEDICSDFWILGESAADSLDACVTNRDVLRYEEFSDPQVVESVQAKAGSSDLHPADPGQLLKEMTQYRCQAMRLDECEDGILILQYFLRNGCIPSNWSDKPLDQVRLFLCKADPSDRYYELCRQKDTTFSMHIVKAYNAQLAEHAFYCPYGAFDAPKVLELTGHEGEHISVWINGLYRYDPWAKVDEFFAMQEKHFSEEETVQYAWDQIIDLIRCCPKGKQLLVLDWQMDSCVPRFFAKNLLDAPYCYEFQILSGLFIPSSGRRMRSVIDVVDDRYHSGLEIELFSYEK